MVESIHIASDSLAYNYDRKARQYQKRRVSRVRTTETTFDKRELSHQTTLPSLHGRGILNHCLSQLSVFTLLGSAN